MCSSARRASPAPIRSTVDGAKLRFKKAMIATGARPDTPAIPGLVEAGYLTNENVFDLTELPRRLLVIGGGPLGCELAQAFCRFGAQTTIAQDMPLFLPKEERDAAQILSDAFARDGIEVRLNTKAVSVRVENGQKLVDLVSDDYKSTVAVDAILTGTGRVPNVEGLNLEAAGVDYDSYDRRPGRRFPADQQSAHLRRRRRLPRAQVHPHRRRFGAHRGPERAVPRPPAAERADDSVVHLHRSGDRPRRPLRPAGARAGHPGEDLHHPDARRGSRDRRRRGRRAS